MTEEEIREMQAELEWLRADNARLQSEMIRLASGGRPMWSGAGVSRWRGL